MKVEMPKVTPTHLQTPQTRELKILERVATDVKTEEKGTRNQLAISAAIGVRRIREHDAIAAKTGTRRTTNRACPARGDSQQGACGYE